jgi:hypothetical protein
MCGILHLPFGCGRFRSIQYSKSYAGNTISLYGPKDKTMAKVEDLAGIDIAADNRSPLLSMEEVDKWYGAFHALKNINLNQNEFAETAMNRRVFVGISASTRPLAR